jgi:hypothetical protein
MRLALRLAAWARGDAPVAALERARLGGIDAYDLVEQLPRGPARASAWAAYVLQVYGDKLVAASKTHGYVRTDTAALARSAYGLASECVAAARELEAGRPPARALPAAPPHWHTPIRSGEQLAGMREALEAMRTFLAFDLHQAAADGIDVSELRAQLAAVDAALGEVDLLWIPRPPAEVRGGIGNALTNALDRAYTLGRRLAML